jgi:hypothetical protein
LILVLDAFLEWRGARVGVNLDVKEKATIKGSLGDERCKKEA